MDLRDLVEWHHGAVVLHLDAVQHVYRSAAGAHGRHFTAEILHRLIHASLQVGIAIFQARNRRHGCLSHEWYLPT